MLDLSDTSIDANYIEQLIDTLYNQAGLGQRQNMNFEAFKRIFASDEYERTLENATLKLQGKISTHDIFKKITAMTSVCLKL